MATVRSNKYSQTKVNWVIRQLSGNYYHEQVEEALTGRPIYMGDGDVCIARHDDEDRPRRFGMFTDVIFVIDDLFLPLRDIVANGLLHANDSGHESIILPTPRTEMAFDMAEKSVLVKQMIAGVSKFRRQRPHTRRCLNNVMLVELSGDTELIQLLKNGAYNFHRR